MGVAGLWAEASWASSSRMAGEIPGRPKSVMVRAPAASRQAVKEQPNASPRPCLDAKKPPAGSAAATIPLLRIGIVMFQLMMTPSGREAEKQKVQWTFCRPNARDAGRGKRTVESLEMAP